MLAVSVELTQQAEPRSEFLDLVRKRLRIALALSAVMVAFYFGFMALFAFDKPLLGMMITPYLSVAMLVGPALILTPVILCSIYVLWTNRVYDPAVRKLDC
jgi:uncharacterized membrane protein (DUF485 family)